MWCHQSSLMELWCHGSQGGYVHRWHPQSLCNVYLRATLLPHVHAMMPLLTANFIIVDAYAYAGSNSVIDAEDSQAGEAAGQRRPAL